MAKNLKIAEAFKKARQGISSDEYDFICHALDGITYRPSRKTCDEARRIIAERMGCRPDKLCPTLESWVWGNIMDGEYSRWPTPEEMKFYRLRWLDSLIAEFS